jgi:hypothetical protein
MATTKITIQLANAEAVRAYQEVVTSQREMERQAKQVTEAHRGTTTQLSEMGRTGTQALTSIAGEAATILSVAGAVGLAFSSWKKEMEETVRNAESLRDATLELALLKETAGKPLREEVFGWAAQAGGRSPEEVAKGRARLEFEARALGTERGEAAWRESLELSRATGQDIASTVKDLAGLMRLVPSMSANEAQNILAKLPQELRPQLRQAADIGRFGQMTFPRALAGAMAAGEVAPTTEEGIADFKRIVKRVMGADVEAGERLTPKERQEREGIFRRLGITEEDDAMTRLMKIAGADLSTEQQRKIFGERGIMAARRILPTLGRAQELEGEYGQALYGRDLAKEQLARLGGDPEFMELERKRQAELRERRAKAQDETATRFARYKAEMGAILHEEGAIPFEVEVAGALATGARFLGVSPEEAVHGAIPPWRRQAARRMNLVIHNDNSVNIGYNQPNQRARAEGPERNMTPDGPME